MSEAKNYVIQSMHIKPSWGKMFGGVVCEVLEMLKENQTIQEVTFEFNDVNIKITQNMSYADVRRQYNDGYRQQRTPTNEEVR